MAVIGTVRCGAGGFGIATNDAHVVHMQCEYVEPTPEQLAAAAAEETVRACGASSSALDSVGGTLSGPGHPAAHCCSVRCLSQAAEELMARAIDESIAR